MNLSLAIPKGRLTALVIRFLAECGIDIAFEDRQLSAVDSSGRLTVYMVKNHDLPTYIHHGIAGLGIVGDDTVAEAGHTLARLFTFPFGVTHLCLAAPKGALPPEQIGKTVTLATSYPRMARQWFHRRGIPVKIIRLDGSVELAPALGLANYIVDLTETGSTLAANGLEIVSVMQEIHVRLVANPAYFKLHYDEVWELIDLLKTRTKVE